MAQIWALHSTVSITNLHHIQCWKSQFPKMTSFSLIIPILLGATICVANPQHICVKEVSHVITKQPIRTSATGFKDLVLHSMIFVDKTLLLKYIMEEESLASFTYPRKWGKSVNLDMMRVFVEQEVTSDGTLKPVNETWSYQFFKYGHILHDNGKMEKLKNPPMIAPHDKVINKYIGKFPAVFIDLSKMLNMQPVFSSFDDFFEIFQKFIAEIFEQHKYLVQLIEKDKSVFHYSADQKAGVLKKFNKFLSGQGCTRDDMIFSIDFLTELMDKGYDTRAIVFVDDYDAFLRVCYIESPSQISSEEAEKIVDFYYSFMRQSVEVNQNLEKGFVSGILHLAIYPMSSIMHYLTKFNILSKNLPPFYGFTRNEIDQLLSFFHIAQNTTQTALESFRAYELCDTPKILIYNPWSIVNFANTGEIEAYWVQTGAFNIFPNALFHKKVREPFETLISRSSDPIYQRNRQFSIDRFDFESMRNMVLLKDVKEFTFNKYTLDLILTYYYMTGYITLKSDLGYDNYTLEVPIRIPNNEVKGAIVSEMANIYQFILGKNMTEAARKASRSLYKFAVEEQHLHYNTSDLKKDLDVLRSLSKDPTIVDEKSIPYYGDPLHNAHFMVLLFLRLDGYDVGFDILHFGDRDKHEIPFIHV